MKTLSALSKEHLARAERVLLNPPLGSRARAAKEYGVDLTLLVEQLRITPAERVKKLESAVKAIESVRGAARKRAR